MTSKTSVDVHHGDCLDVLLRMASEGAQVDSVVTDPPYHLTSIVKRFGAADAAPAKSDGPTGAYERASKGFMGKTWDGGDVAFRAETWAAVFAIMKPGAHLLAFGGTRTYHRMVCAIEDAGFEIRDQIGWVFGSGFPKSHNVSKGIDKAAPATDAARQWEGWGTALKPAWEPICLARKPLAENTIAANVLAHGTGALNIDACRVEGGGPSSPRGSSYLDTNGNRGWMRPWMEDRAEVARRESAAMDRLEQLGRWPANVIHDGSDEVLAGFPEGGGGSAARFFYHAKANTRDRAGSKHPTVKPIDLIAYLCRLVTPPGGTVLDPFAGSGTTGTAALREGFNAILIEREREHYDDIMRRLSAVAEAGSLSRRSGKRSSKQKQAPND